MKWTECIKPKPNNVNFDQTNNKNEAKSNKSARDTKKTAAKLQNKWPKKTTIAIKRTFFSMNVYKCTYNVHTASSIDAEGYKKIIVNYKMKII